MSKRSTEIDKYIANAADFTRPILEKIRKLYHQACPEIEETIKWGFPHFEYKGIVGSMAAFKHHVGFGFWKGTMLKDPKGRFRKMGNTSMVSLKVEKLEELPPDKEIVAYIKEAVALNEQGVKAPARPKSKKPAVSDTPPEDFLAALKKNKNAMAAFNAFSPGNKREYVAWITEAKQLETRQKRIATALEWIAEGKSRNWKYQK